MGWSHRPPWLKGAIIVSGVTLLFDIVVYFPTLIRDADWIYAMAGITYLLSIPLFIFNYATGLIAVAFLFRSTVSDPILAIVFFIVSLHTIMAFCIGTLFGAMYHQIKEQRGESWPFSLKTGLSMYVLLLLVQLVFVVHS